MILLKFNSSFLFLTFFTAFLFTNTFTKPIGDEKETFYNKFINILMQNNCTMPHEVELPFSSNSEQLPFSYLSEPLKKCQTSNAEIENEAKFLCNEIFDVFGNITCAAYSKPLPKIKNPLSENVCNDFKNIQTVFPKEEDYLSGKLVDSTLCKLLCFKDYEQLCKTLVWSYGVLNKIKSSLENGTSVTEKGIVNKTSLDTNSIKINLVKNTGSSDKQVNMKTDILNEDEKKLQSVSKVNESSVFTESISNRTANLTTSLLHSTNIKTTNVSKPKIRLESSNEKVPSTDDMPSPLESDQNFPSRDGFKQNGVVNADVSTIKGTVSISDHPESNADSLTVKTNNATYKNKKTSPLSSLPDGEKIIDVNNIKISKTKEEPQREDNFVSQDDEMDNELSNVNMKDEVKTKQTDVKSKDKLKEMEKPPLTDFETPLGSSDANMKLTDPTIPPPIPDRDEDIEHQEEKEQDQYNDTENDGDYPKSEYENSFNPSSKNKESIVKSSVAEISNQMSNSYDTLLGSNIRNNIGHVPDGIHMVSSFPEQEDSHFFFYFLSVVLILMAGYLIFHNKQKIIALIVEGRHERRRRSHGAAYKKLETK